MSLLIGYGRVSTIGQDLAQQRALLTEAGCTRIFEEKASGAKRDRPELARMLDHLRPGDSVLVTRLDRLARSTIDLLTTAERLREAGAGLKSLAEPWAETTTPAEQKERLQGQKRRRKSRGPRRERGRRLESILRVAKQIPAFVPVCPSFRRFNELLRRRRPVGREGSVGPRRVSIEELDTPGAATGLRLPAPRIMLTAQTGRCSRPLVRCCCNI